MKVGDIVYTTVSGGVRKGTIIAKLASSHFDIDTPNLGRIHNVPVFMCHYTKLEALKQQQGFLLTEQENQLRVIRDAVSDLNDLIEELRQVTDRIAELEKEDKGE